LNKSSRIAGSFFVPAAFAFPEALAVCDTFRCKKAPADVNPAGAAKRGLLLAEEVL
jgi:hypothetical protein